MTGVTTWITGTRWFWLGLIVGALLVQFTLLVLAETALIEPNGDGSITATQDTCGGAGNFDCLNDGVATTSIPATGSDFLRFLLNDIDFYLMETVSDVDTVSEVRVNLYHGQTDSNVAFNVSLYAANELTQYGTAVTFPNRTVAGWDTATFSGLSLTQAQLDDMRVRLECVRAAGAKPGDCLGYALSADVVYSPLIEVTVGNVGTQQNLTVGTTSAHVGGAFTITENVSARNVTSITVTENGSIDAANNLSNIKLFYDLDTTLPYDCASESYSGTESQFGTTNAGGFSGANGTVTFTDSVGISTTATMCVYPVLDVSSTTPSGDTIELELSDPTTDVGFAGTIDIEPATTVALTGTTFIEAQDRNQIHYHWRNDDGDETDGVGGATSATGGSEDATLNALGVGAPIRLRFGVSNEGNRTSDPTTYRLEYAQKVSTCSAATGWADVGAAGGDFDMRDSANLTDGNDTTNIVVSSGGVSDENLTFLTPNGGVRDTTSQTGSITLTAAEYVDLEYSLEATTNATAGNTYCFRLTDAGSLLETYSVYPEATILADITVSTLGTLNNTVEIPTASVEAGAQFVITDNIAGITTVQGIDLTASGTVDLQADIEDIELRYDLDTTAPYNCVGETYAGTEAQFGATVTNGFSVSNVASFTDSQVINPAQTMCIYVIYTATSTIANDEQIDFRITNPSAHVTIDAGTVAPNALVDLPGVTTFVETEVRQTNYHWRDDNGSETGASSATGGSENTVLENVRPGVPYRLRLGVANLGSLSAAPQQYRLEYALRVTSCSAATGWTDVGAAADELDMFNSANITEGSNTTNISVANGGVSDVGSTFLTPNGGVRDTSSQTGSITLAGKNFVDLEYAIVASSSASDGSTYCFRVTDAGTPIDGYDNYGQLTIKPPTDFFIQRGVTTIAGTGGGITAGTDYVAPASAANAFIRIVGTHNTGAGSPTNSGNADDVTVYVSNPANITSGITFTRPAAAADTTRVAWEIIEYVGAPGGDNEMIVRQQSALTYGSANTTVTSGTVAGIVDDTDVAIFVTGQLNPDTGTGYPLGLSTAVWNAGADTATFTRGGSGNAAALSYAVVEFTGDQWKVQRSEHTYTAAGTTETESITAVNSLQRAFLHTQKRMAAGLNNHADFGHNVWLSGIGQISYELQNGASTPGSHTSVAWVVENTQTVGDTMVMTPSNGAESSGSSPKSFNVNIGTTISDTQDASLFINNFANEAGSSGANSFPEPIYSAELISNTQYQLWVADPDNDTRTWRAEVVEWPTATADVSQNDFAIYENDPASITPSDRWGTANIGENTPMSALDDPMAPGDVARIRMNVEVSSALLPANLFAYELQYAELVTSCSAVSNWLPVGNAASSTALWRGFDNTPVDGTPLSSDPPAGGDLLISTSNVAGTYEEDDTSALNPYEAFPGESVEYDWVVQHNGASDKTSYCFRMVKGGGELLDGYQNYPVLRTVGFEPQITNWRWYDDEASVTPTTPLANEDIAPIDIANTNEIKLRLVLQEVSGAAGTDAKFALEFSEYADFSQTATVTATTTCVENSLWCYADGAGIDNAQIDSAVLSAADACTGGVGSGCGTHNESATNTTTATFDHAPYTSAEYEFTLRQAGARANAVYYFRLYDVQNDEYVGLSGGATYPSLQVEGAQLVFSVAGLASGTSTGGVVTDATTTANTIDFQSIPVNGTIEAAQRLTVDTNATEGYQVLLFADQQLTNAFADEIAAITSTNAAPTAWTDACLTSAASCFGYHSTDATLAGGSGRFAPDDSYAALSTEPAEVVHSSVPAVDVRDIVYRVFVDETQALGTYSAAITYVVVPTF